MSPLRALLMSLSVSLGCAAVLLAPTFGLGPPNSLVASIEADAARSLSARLLVLGNSAADSSLDDATFSTAALGSPTEARVLTVPGGGPQALGALLRNGLKAARPEVVLVWLLPATWRETAAPESQDIAQLLALAGPGDVTLADRLYGGSRTRLLWAQWAAGRGHLRDNLLQSLTQTAAMPVLGRQRPAEVFAAVVGDWAPVSARAGEPDPTWPERNLAPLQADVQALGAELWLIEPFATDVSPHVRFTAAERQAMTALGIPLVAAPDGLIPPEAVNGGHVLPAWKTRASEAAGRWLRTHAPTAALSVR